jgi:hypothetical protein
MKTRRRKQRGGNLSEWLSTQSNNLMTALQPADPNKQVTEAKAPFKFSSLIFGNGNSEDDVVEDVRNTLSGKMNKLDQQIAALQQEIDDLASNNKDRSQTIEAQLAKKMAQKEKLQGILTSASEDSNNQPTMDATNMDATNMATDPYVTPVQDSFGAVRDSMQAGVTAPESASETLLTPPDATQEIPVPDAPTREITPKMGGRKRRSKKNRSSKLRRRYGYSRRSSRRRRTRR